jgi:hypothetical protein
MVSVAVKPFLLCIIMRWSGRLDTDANAPRACVESDAAHCSWRRGLIPAVHQGIVEIVEIGLLHPLREPFERVGPRPFGRVR